MQRRDNRIKIIGSSERVNLLQIYVGDVAANIEKVASGTCDLANVTSHEEVGIMEECVANPTKAMFNS